MTTELQSLVCDLDFETKSYADLKKVGTWAYTEHPTTDIICACYAFGDGPVMEWWPGCDVKHVGGMPYDLYMHVMLGGLIRAANCPFEMGIIENVLVPRYDWVAPPGVHRYRDPLRVAGYYSLPQNVDALAKVLGFPGKDPKGKRLISKYSNLYLKTAKTEIPDVDFFAFVDYCAGDVREQRSIGDFLGGLPEQELELFKLWLRQDRHGLGIDVDAVNDALFVVDKRVDELTEEFKELTGLAPTQRDKVKEWINERLEDPLENLQAETIEEALKIKGMDPEARRALEIRSQSSSASVKKILAMQNQVSADGRIRFQTKYHGTVTGRKSGVGMQPLNMNRGFEGADPELMIREIRRKDPKWLDMLFGDAIDAVAKATRHFVKAADGHRFIVGDWVSIEAVVSACLAGEEWKIEAFRNGEPLYELTADMIFGFPPGTVTKKTHPAERQVGKVGELAFTYQGAVGAWRQFDDSDRYTDDEVQEFKKGWRKKNAMIVKLWAGLEKAAIAAVQDSDQEPHYYREIGFEMQDEWLSMILPNGKRIWYWRPEVSLRMPAWHKPRENEDCATGECDHEPVPQLSYWAQKTGQWGKVYTYGGKLTENCLGGDTEILTNAGWMRIKDYTPGIKLWDGKNWVYGGKLLDQGRKPVVDVGGVYMTPDHLVLTEEGWKSASQSEKYNRARVRLPEGHRLRRVERGKKYLGFLLSELRGLLRNARYRLLEACRSGCASVLRLCEKRAHKPARENSRDVKASGLRRVPFHARALWQTVAPCVPQLRGPWGAGMQTLARRLFQLLERHGGFLRSWAVVGSDRQQPWVFEKELSVGEPEAASEQPETVHSHKHTMGRHEPARRFEEKRGAPQHDHIPHKKQMAGGQTTGAPGRTEQEVYDIANVGPLNRFTVRGRTGEIFIVHNCTQAAAREILAACMLRLDEAGYKLILDVYDEIVAEMPYGEGSLEEFKSIMLESPGEWAADWPISVDLWEGERYKK